MPHLSVHSELLPLLTALDGKRTLHLLIKYLLGNKIVIDLLGVLTLLNEFVTTVDTHKAQVQICDLKGNGEHFNRLRTQLERFLNPQPVDTNPARTRCAQWMRMHGIAGHNIATSAYGGNLLYKPQDTLFDLLPAQPNCLFTEPGELEDACPYSYSDAFRISGGLSKFYLRALERESNGLFKALQNARQPWLVPVYAHLEIRHLAQMLQPIVGKDCLAQIQPRHRYSPEGRRGPLDPQERALQLVTLLSWVSTLLWCDGQEQTPVVFAEVPVFGQGVSISGGRMDVVEVVSVNGRTPTARQRRDLRSLSRNARFGSMGHLRRAANATAGGPCTFSVRDWKFAVGDGKEGQVIHAAKVAKSPYADHRRQIGIYMSTTQLTSLPPHTKPAEFSKYWDQEVLCHEGSLIYLFPGITPVVHTSAPDQDERTATFRNTYLREGGLLDSRVHTREAVAAIGRFTLDSERNGHTTEVAKPKPVTPDLFAA